MGDGLRSADTEREVDIVHPDIVLGNGRACRARGTGGDGVYQDAAALEFARQRRDETVQPRLGRVLGRGGVHLRGHS